MKTTQSLFFGVLTIMAALATKIPAQSFLTNGLVAYYPFNGNANDASGNGNTGTVYNAAFVPDQNGVTNGAIQFNGGNPTSSYVSVTPTSSLNFTNGATVSLWCAVDGPGTYSPRLVSIYTAGGGAYYTAGGGNCEIGLRNGTPQQFWFNYATNQYPQVPLTNAITGGKWVHLVGVGTATSAELFVNGVLVSNITGRFDADIGQATLMNIGRLAVPSNDDFNGRLDEVRIYNRALSTNEVAQLYAYESAPPPAYSAPAGLVAWWRGEGNANDFFGLNNGTLVGGVSFTNGKVGQAFRFDGSSGHVTIPDSPSLDVLTNRITVETWIKVNHTNVNSDWEGIVTKGGNSWRLDATSGSNTVYFAYDPSPGVNVDVYGTRNVNDGNWHHVAGVYDGTNISLYVDGSLDVTRAASGLIYQTSDPVGIGYQTNSPTSLNFFDGLIDEASIYNRGLAASEIAAIYNAGSAGKSFLSGIPVITGFSPTSGTVGSSVTITGANFSAVATGNLVHFGAVRATVQTASATSLTVTVPSGATFAPITLAVNGLTAYAGSPFLPTFPSAGAFTNTSLGPRVNLGAGNGPSRVVIADLDGDGKPDVVAANVYDGTVYIYRNLSTNGTLATASFAPPVIFTIGGGTDSTWGLAVADLTGDGRLDIVVANRNFNLVSIFQNQCLPGVITSNSFGARVDLPVAGVPYSVAVADLDGDGRPDIITTDSGSNAVSVLQNLGTGGMITTNTFAAPVNFAVGSSPAFLGVADLDGDGRPDIIAVNNSDDTNNAVSVLRNISTVGNIALAPTVNFAGLTSSREIVIGDLDGDGKLDLAVCSGNTGQTLSIYRNTGSPGSITTSSFAAHVDFALGGWGNTVALGDLDGDGKPDVIVSTQLPNQLEVFRNTSAPGSFTTSSLASKLVFSTGSNPNGMAIGDLDGDGRADIALGNSSSATVSLYQNIVPFGAPPVVTVQPTNQTVTVGMTATFSVTATGTAPLRYQWSFGVTNLPGATNATLTLTNVQLAQAGHYSVLVTNLAGSTNSFPGVLTVNPLPAYSAPSGLVAWWPGEGNANDVAGTNNGIPSGIAYAGGEVGQAFVFNGSSSMIRVPASPALNVGLGSGFTIETWINPANLNVQIISEWNQNNGIPFGTTQYGVTWSINAAGPGAVNGNVVDTNGIEHNVTTSNNLITTNSFQHLAFTYDKASGMGMIYWNGSLVASTNLGTLAPKTGYDFFLGKRPSGNLTGNYFNGEMDEPSVYNRALTSNEIAVIFNAGSAGKSLPSVAPAITAQPQSRTNLVGTTATFTVTATGTAPLSYQWSFGVTNLPGATNATLTLTNVQLAQAGHYSVLVTNLAGSTNSFPGVLTVNPLPAYSAPSGLVAWWPGEGNANDVAGTNNGIPSGIAYAGGEVGQAFVFNGSSSMIRVPASPALNVGLGSGFTIETWINPANLNVQIISEWNQNNGIPFGTTQYGVTWSINAAGPGAVNGNVVDTNGIEHNVTTSNNLITTNSFQHLAFTYDKASGMGMIYWNGSLVASTNLGTLAPKTGYDFFLGKRPSGNLTGNYFNGEMDEPSVYNRALTSNEIAAIFNAGSAGKSLPSVAPVITAQPQSQTNLVGTTATFTVTATGTAPLSYQWSFGVTNLPGATNATLTLTNVQLARAGNYSVLVTNLAGSTNSLAAVLTVNPLPAYPVPSGLVAWWSGEGNANDVLGINNGTLVGGVSFTNGEVGQAFRFDGSSGNVSIPNSPSLNVFSNRITVETWIKVNHSTVNSQWEGIVTKGNSSWRLQATSGAKTVYFGYDTSPNVYVDVYGTRNVNDGQWHHVAGVYDGTNLFLYVDGTLDVSRTASGLIYQTSDPVCLGTTYAVNSPYNYSFDGLVDEASIYNRGLSAGEIMAIYNAGSAGKYAPPQPPQPPQDATASAVLAGNFVVGVTNLNGGSGYTNPPLVRFIGGGGSGAGGYAVINHGVVTGIVVTNAGSSYTTAPLVVIEPPFIPNPVLALAPMSFLTFSNLTVSGNYQLQRLAGWYWTNLPVSFTATSPVYSQAVPGTAGGGGYRLALNPVPAQAFATPVMYAGFVVGATMTSLGSGYVTSPAVTIVGQSDLAAAGYATISGGMVTGITITNAGYGYLSPPTIQIAPPPAVAVSPLVQPVMRVDATSLAPYDNYQIQFTPDLGATWQDVTGGLFTPTGATNSQYLVITNGVGFIRLQYMP